MQTTKEETRTIYVAKVSWYDDEQQQRFVSTLHCFYKEEHAKAYVEAKQKDRDHDGNPDRSTYYYEDIILWNNSIIGNLK